MNKYAIAAVIIVLSLFFGFQNCSNNMKAKDNPVNIFDSAGALGVYSFAAITEIDYQSPANTTPAPNLVLKLMPDSANETIHIAENDPGKCHMDLAAADFEVFKQNLRAATLGPDGNSNPPGATDPQPDQVTLLFDDGSSKTYQFQNGSHFPFDVILNGTVLDGQLLAYLQLGCQSANALTQVPLNTITQLTYQNVGGQIGPTDPIRVLTIALDLKAPLWTVVKTLYNQTSNAEITQCTLNVGAIDVDQILMNLRSATLGPDNSNLIVQNAGDNHLSFQISGSSAGQDFIFDGGDNEHTGNVILPMPSPLQSQLENYLDTISCPIPAQ